MSLCAYELDLSFKTHDKQDNKRKLMTTFYNNDLIKRAHVCKKRSLESNRSNPQFNLHHPPSERPARIHRPNCRLPPLQEYL